MAVDTENRRRSACQFPIIPVYVVPDGAIAGADRMHIAWLYRGVFVAAVAAVDQLMMKGMGGES